MSRIRDQRGISMIDHILWVILAVVLVGGVTAFFVSTSQQTAVAAEQTNQQQSILNALNRASRDVSVSNPIVYATSTQIVMDVDTGGGKMERRRYLLDTTAKQVIEMSKPIAIGEAYDPSNSSYWSAAPHNAVDVYRVKTDAPAPFLAYYDKNAAPLSGDMSGAATEAIARVDFAVTADVANKGNVSLSTSAVPRSTQNLGGTADTPAATCPAFTATRNGYTVVLQWDAAPNATGYEVTRNGTTLSTVAPVSGQTSYSYSDSPGQSGTVLNYMLKVDSAGGIANCTDSVQTVVVQTGATQLTTALGPATTLDSTGTPVSTAWTDAKQVTSVNFSWPKVDGASGYVIYKQALTPTGDYVAGSQRQVVADLETSDYTASTAPATLTYQTNTNWEEYWEWSIKVLARTGDNDNTPAVRTLSYPHPVTDASVRASNYGENTITWNYTEGMNPRGFDIYRSAIDTPTANFPAGFTKIGSADAGITSFTDKNAELGSTYGYYVVAKNSSGFANGYASQLVQQLQFPPDPVMTPTSANGSRDQADGTNLVLWSAAKSATGYQVQRWDVTASQAVCMSATNCGVNGGGIAAPTTSYTDSSSAVVPASRFTYLALAYNSTGMSQGLAAQVALTQRPPAPSVSVSASPTLSTTNTSIQYGANAGSWCVSGSYSGSGTNNCSYEQETYNNSGAQIAAAANYGSPVTLTGQDWGRHYTYTVRSRNEAITNSGWSDYSNRPAADTYPGPFTVNAWVGTGNGSNQQRINYTSKIAYGGWGDQSVAGYSTTSWGQSTGAGTVSVVRNSLDSKDAVNATDSSILLPDTATPTITWNGTTQTTNGSSQPSSYSPGSASGQSTYIAAPGATYSYTITMTSKENTLQRAIGTGNFITPADVPQSGLLRVVCSGPPEPTGNTSVAWPSQLIASRLDGYNVSSMYGNYYSTRILRFNQYQQNGSYSQDQPMITLYPGQSVSGPWFNSSPGIGYFYGISSAWQLWNVGLNYGPVSATLNLNMQTLATFEGCAPQGDTGDQLIEPYDACYDYEGGVCMALNDQDRPRWQAK